MSDFNGYNGEQNMYNSPMMQPEKKGQSIASLVLGICSFIAWLIPLFGYPVSIVGIVMGAMGMKKGGKKMAIAGIICSSIGLLITLINSIAGVIMMMGMMN
ncbi:MAG: DUF4190 domain-containing protein [Lachnospiraceae bacterium]|nr:DUF4190 domain-containing protein [Lachnospiraceae bacterium]